MIKQKESAALKSCVARASHLCCNLCDISGCKFRGPRRSRDHAFTVYVCKKEFRLNVLIFRVGMLSFVRSEGWLRWEACLRIHEQLRDCQEIYNRYHMEVLHGVLRILFQQMSDTHKVAERSASWVSSGTSIYLAIVRHKLCSKAATASPFSNYIFAYAGLARRKSSRRKTKKWLVVMCKKKRSLSYKVKV